MRAVVLVGHGSLRPGSGAAMIRMAARVRAAGVAPIVSAGFLNYSRPTFADALERCVARGAYEVVVQPYFLVPGKFVGVDIPQLVRAGRAARPTVALRSARPFGDHPALAKLVLKRAAEASSVATFPRLICAGAAPLEDAGALSSEEDTAPAGLLIMAHGSPDPAANRPIDAIAGQVRAGGAYEHVVVCYMELNQPSIPDAIDDLVARGVRRIIAMPYFLQLGGHVAEDLPAQIGAARARHPTTAVLLAEHLAYDPLLVAVIADRVSEALAS